CPSPRHPPGGWSPALPQGCGNASPRLRRRRTEPPVRFLIRTWTRQSGENVSRDREVEVDRLRIGRGTDQEVELPDLRVALSHAEIVRSGKNAVIVTKPGAAMQVNGAPTTEHRLHGGDLIVIGLFLLVVLPGLAVPAWLRFGHPPAPAAAEYVPPQPAAGLAALKPTDAVWVPGTSSSAHAYFQKDCAKCHQSA